MAKTLEGLLGDHLIRQNGDKVPINTLCGKDKILGIYFSAEWCPPCKGFTPKLVEFYKTFGDKGSNIKFEVVFVSWDKDETAYKEHFETMPWLALPWGEERKVSCLGCVSSSIDFGDRGRLKNILAFQLMTGAPRF